MNNRLMFLLISLSFILAQAAHADEISRDPAHATDHLIVADGLQCALFAAEPQLVNPSAIDVDHRGRVWVCEIVNYRARDGARPEGDRIVILSDSDHDGRADESTVFYQGKDLVSPHGICVLATPDGKGTRAIVSVGSRIVVLIDDNGDDRADRQEDLFTGINGTQHDHGVHAVVFGPDGRLYFNCGNEAHHYFDAQGRAIRDLAGNIVNSERQPYQQAMVFRSNLDGSHFETLGWNFRNPWMVTVDSFGNPWQSDNDDDGNRGCRINFISEFGNYGYRDEMTGAYWQRARTGQNPELPWRHWHANDPGVTPSVHYTGSGSPAGITVYEGNLLPKQDGAQLLHCDPGSNAVSSYAVTAKGAGYEATPKMLLSSEEDRWFRPVDVKVGPDGSLLVADWYDPGVGGHHVVDLQRGRIFRIAATNPVGKYEVPKFDFSTPAGTVVALDSPNYAARAVAWHQLLKFGSKAEPALAKQWESGDPLLRSRALWLLGTIAKDPLQYIHAAVADKNPQLRIVGIRVARQHQLDLLPLVKRVIGDPSPQIQRELAIALAYDSSEQAAELWAQLATNYQGGDRWLLEALGASARGKWGMRLAAWLKKNGDDFSSPGAKDIIWRSRAAETPALLAQLLVQAEDEPTDRYFRAFDLLTSTSKQAALRSLLDHNPPLKPAIVVGALERLPEIKLADVPDAATALDKFLDENRDSAKYHQLILRYHLTDRRDELLERLISTKDEATATQDAQTLVALGGQPKLVELAQTLKLDNNPVDSNAAIITLGRLNKQPINRALLEHVKNDALKLELRQAALTGLASSIGGQRLLLDVLRDGSLPTQFNFAAANALHSSTNQEIRQAAAELVPLPESAEAANLPPLAELVQQHGDARRGKQVFASTGTCIKCHQVLNEGKEVGPNLSEIGTKLSRQAMYESILAPSAGINHNYQQFDVFLASGKSISGLLINQTDQELTIRNAEGIDQTLAAEEVEEIVKSELSLMPAGLQKQLTKQQLIDLIEYLMTLKKL